MPEESFIESSRINIYNADLVLSISVVFLMGFWWFFGGKLCCWSSKTPNKKDDNSASCRKKWTFSLTLRKTLFQNAYFLIFFFCKRNGLQKKETMRWSKRVQTVAWTAKSDQQLQKHILPLVAFGCSTVLEVLGSKSGGLGAKKQKLRCNWTNQ